MNLDILNTNTKAGVLNTLKFQLRNFNVPKLLIVSCDDWQSHKENILNKITTYFHSDFLVVRSSYSTEDNSNNAKAGEFDSVLSVPRNSPKDIEKAINCVITSYLKERNSFKGEELFIQEMVADVAMSGVVFTHDLSTGAPYYVFNYDDISGKTDSVTAGIGEYSNRTLYVFRDLSDELRSERFKILIKAIIELENQLNSKFLDIEFALDKDLKPYLLQVRPITAQVNWDHKLSIEINKELKGIRNFVRNRFNNVNGIYGNTTVFGQMPDWNPAEMLGRSPRALSLSLYECLITDNAWRIARQKCGYFIPKGQPLMVSLAGQPFIDTRLSFNSFLPKSLDPSISKKLIDHWVNKLRESPHLHDKIEFDVAITAYSFDIDEKLNDYNFLSKNEKEIFKKSLFEITIPLIKGVGKASIKNSLSKISILDNLDYEKINNNFSNTFELIEDIINYGTIPFSILARHGFIAKIILTSLVKKNILTQDNIDNFFSSISTVASDLLIDMNKLKNNKITLSEFMQNYGHLRPGTYDILSKRYDQFEKFDLSNDDLKFQKDLKNNFQLSKLQLLKIDEIIKSNHIENYSSKKLFEYCKNAIKAREYAKFVFTKKVSRLIENIANFGNEIGLNREEISHLPISTLIKYLSHSSSTDYVDELRKTSYINSLKHKISTAIRLPQILHDDSGVFIVPFQVSHPNFITNKKVESAAIFIDTKDTDIELNNKIILIENADPGFDWIFSKRIQGLITKYGGVNSHMAIRCAEFGIPAAIGCGEQRFESLLSKDKIILDCGSGVISGAH